MSEIIEPALVDRSVVLCDRFISATYAYQGAAGYNMSRLLEMGNMAIGDRWPDLTIVIDVPVDQAFERIEGERHDSMESRPREFHERVRENFLHLKGIYPSRVEIVDGTGSEEDVQTRVVELIERVDF
jgi:dTMP kinase